MSSCSPDGITADIQALCVVFQGGHGPLFYVRLLRRFYYLIKVRNLKRMGYRNEVGFIRDNIDNAF